MARNSIRGTKVQSLGRPVSLASANSTKWYASATSKSTSNNGYGMAPFGPALADDVFKLYDYGHDEPECSDDSYYHLQSIEDAEPVQLNFELETVRDMENRLLNEISKFKRGYQKMMVYALQWHHLMEELDSNPQLEKMFNDLQMIRKLTGSEAV